MALLHSAPRSATVTAETDTRPLVLGSREFSELIQSFPVAGRRGLGAWLRGFAKLTSPASPLSAPSFSPPIRRPRVRLRDLLQPLGDDDPPRCFDQCEVGESLREVAEVAPRAGVELLRIQ